MQSYSEIDVNCSICSNALIEVLSVSDGVDAAERPSEQSLTSTSDLERRLAS